MLNQNNNLPQDQIQRMQQLLQYYKYDMMMRELKKVSSNNSINQSHLNIQNLYNLQSNPLINLPNNNYLLTPQMDLNTRQESLFSGSNFLPNFTNTDLVEVNLY
jgi:hypothetical protein